MTKIVMLIEDNIDDAALFGQLLEAAGDIKVEHVGVRAALSDYTDLLASPETGAIIIDERLSDYGGVDYTGLDLADYLRTLRPEIPIYILTHYPDDIPEDHSGSTELIIDKTQVRKAAKAYVTRMLRQMQRYDDALTEQQKRLKDLIDRKLAQELTEQEQRELEQLRADIERPLGPTMIDAQSKWERELGRQEKLLREIEKLLPQNLDASDDQE